MQLKPITSIAVILLVVASLLVAGCTTTTTNTATNQTPSVSATPSAATHNATLENYLAVLNNTMYSQNDQTVKAFEITWINSTSARLHDVEVNKTTNLTYSGDSTYILFPTTQDATNHLNAMNKTAYSLASTKCENSSGGAPGAYKNVTGHAPQICKEYDRSEGASSSSLDYRRYAIVQYDNLIMEITAKNLE